MQVFEIILNIIVLIGIGAIFLFVKRYLPSYMNEKGRNLATKEDVEEITSRTEEVQRQFKEQFEMFSSDVRFKYRYGRWYYGHHHQYRCEFGGNKGL